MYTNGEGAMKREAGEDLDQRKDIYEEGRFREFRRHGHRITTTSTSMGRPPHWF